MIHWITDRLGTAAWDSAQRCEDIHLVDVRDLVDKGGNAIPVIRSKIEEALESIREGKKAVICCDYGMSRSNAIAAGVLATYEGIALDEAVRRILAATGEYSIKIGVLSTVRRAMGQDRDCSSRKNASRKVLVTGISGFIGSSIITSLKSKYDTFAPTHQEIDLVRDTVLLDILIKEKAIDTIIHLANPRIYTTNESMGNSLVMLKNVLDICVENNLSLIYLSSWEIYSGYKTKEMIVDESLSSRPGGTYGQTKFISEIMIDQCQKMYGLPYTILRSSPVYGPGSDRPKFIWNFFDKAMNNKEIITHKYINGFPSLDLLYIDDLCNAILAAAEHQPLGIINIGTGIGTSTLQIAEHIVKLIGSKSKIKHIDIDAYAGNIIMDNSHAKEVIGWSPKINLIQGLKKTLQLFKEENK